MHMKTVSLILLVLCSASQTRSASYANNQMYRPGNQISRQYDNHRYHPTTYSKESTEDTDMKGTKMPVQDTNYFQYAYQGGQALQNQEENLQVYQGEVINHAASMQDQKQPITQRPPALYQQMIKKPTSSESPATSDVQFSLPSAIYLSQGEPSNDAHGEYPAQDDHHHFHLPHEELHGYHYPYPTIPKPPPPDKSKATVSEADYAYYYIGRHLWYVPLYFSIYFIAYVGLLVLKSIARHKVLFPYKAEQAGNQNGRQLEALNLLESGQRKYHM